MNEASTSYEAGPDSLRIVLVDDHEFVLEGVKQRFEEVSDLAVVGVANSVATAIEVIAQERPDFAVVDFRLPDGDGIELVKQIRDRSPTTLCVIYTSVSFADDVSHEADAVVIKELFEDKLIETIRDLRDRPTNH